VSARSDFVREYGREPTGVWSAPGRVNLIGEHTDYSGGLVLPFAIAQRTWCALASRDDRIITAGSTSLATRDAANLDSLDASRLSGWSAYVFGVVWALAEAGADLSERRGFDLLVTSTVPIGAGLSSSAALECSVALALNDVWDLGLSRRELAEICQRAENGVVGAPTGIMDQSASLFASAGHAVMLDCTSGDHELVPLAFEREGLVVTVIDTGVRHDHATGGYASRRAACERAAVALDVPTLRCVSEEDLARASEILDDVTFRRVRHVVTENGRVAEAARVLKDAGPGAIGPLLTASHASMRDDFEISVPEIDLAVETALASGALGARLTGGGFGGSAIALTPIDHVESLTAAVMEAFAEAGFKAPHVFTVAPSEGARRDE
jgi:galactokinase